MKKKCKAVVFTRRLEVGDMMYFIISPSYDFKFTENIFTLQVPEKVASHH